MDWIFCLGVAEIAFVSIFKLSLYFLMGARDKVGREGLEAR
jgi:hypothetical protein